MGSIFSYLQTEEEIKEDIHVIQEVEKVEEVVKELGQVTEQIVKTIIIEVVEDLAIQEIEGKIHPQLQPDDNPSPNLHSENIEKIPIEKKELSDLTKCRKFSFYA